MAVRYLLYILAFVLIVGHAAADTYNLSATNGTQISPPWPVQFTDVSGIVGVSYFWDFGDGATSTEQNPVHWYTTAGVFNVSFMVSDGANVYWDNKTGFIFSRKNGLPVPFNGHSDEFDMPESILLYNGTVPISDFWDISLYNGHSVLSYTGLRELEYNGSAIFYAPSWLNGNSNAHYKFPIPSTYTWNFAKTTIDCQMGYFLTQTNGSTSFGGYDTKYPPQLTFRTANYSEYSANLIWTRGQETTWEFWISAQPGSRSRIISVVSIPYDIYYNLTIQEEAANYYYVYLNTIYTAGNTFQNNVNAENGFAGYCLDNYQISDMCGDVDPGNYSSLKFDNWSFLPGRPRGRILSG